MKPILLMISMLGAVTSLAMAQKQDLKWGEYGCYSNWKRYPYEIDSNYPWLGKLPDLRDFPKLLETALNPKWNQSERAVILSQMKTLSRCDFYNPFLKQGEDAETEYRGAVAKWKDWWLGYGLDLSRSLTEKGQRNEKAWAQIAPSPYLECPQYPILIPQTWSSTITFRSGDYGGVTEEVIEFRVAKDACELRRRYRTGSFGQGAWTHEQWQGFSQQEADHFMASLIYLIDHPWFFANDQLSEVEEGKKQSKISHIRGRPKAWTDYYAGYEWTGVLNTDQKVIINYDPWAWDTIDSQLGPKTSLEGGPFGIVFRLVRDLFPDPEWMADTSRWKRVEK